jgi:hypothetical protein
MASRTYADFPWAGLMAGPAAWAISTEANYALANWTCVARLNVIIVLSILLVLIALFGAFVSWKAWKTFPRDVSLDESTSYQPRRFVAASGIFLGVLFALVTATQGSASLVLSGCVR